MGFVTALNKVFDPALWGGGLRARNDTEAELNRTSHESHSHHGLPTSAEQSLEGRMRSVSHGSRVSMNSMYHDCDDGDGTVLTSLSENGVGESTETDDGNDHALEEGHSLPTISELQENALAMQGSKQIRFPVPASPPESLSGSSLVHHLDDVTVTVSNVTGLGLNLPRLQGRRKQMNVDGKDSSLRPRNQQQAHTQPHPTSPDNHRRPHLAGNREVGANQEDNNMGILVAHGVEQWMSVPALLLLCPFAGLVTTLAALDERDYDWQACLVEKNIRRVAYGFQCGGFSALMFLGLEFLGDRFVREAFPGIEQNAASRMFQKQLAVLVAACGIGITIIEDTLARQTSIFVSAFAVYLLFTARAHLSQGLPPVLSVAFLWNGAQLLIIAWIGGTGQTKT